jgi:hypothetical protein
MLHMFGCIIPLYRDTVNTEEGMVNNYPYGLPGYDAWKSTDAEGEKRAKQAEYCDDHHNWNRQGYECPECAQERERIEEGPDPDDARDRAREEHYQLEADEMIPQEEN